MGSGKRVKHPYVVKHGNKFVVGINSRPMGPRPLKGDDGKDVMVPAIALHFCREDDSSAKLTGAARSALEAMINRRTSFTLVELTRSELIVIYSGVRPVQEATVRLCRSVRDLFAEADYPVDLDIMSAMAVHSHVGTGGSYH